MWSTSTSEIASAPASSLRSRITPFSATMHRPVNTLSVVDSPVPGAAIIIPASRCLERYFISSSASWVEVTVAGKDAIWAISVAPSMAWLTLMGTSSFMSLPTSTATVKSLFTLLGNTTSLVSQVSYRPPTTMSTGSSSGQLNGVPFTSVRGTMAMTSPLYTAAAQLYSWPPSA